MLEKATWFAVIYACISISVTVLMLVFANKALRLRGSVGMVRALCPLVLAVAGLIGYVLREIFGSQDSIRKPSGEIKKTT